MSLMGNLYGRMALAKQAKGDIERARAQYEKALNAGMNAPRFALAYSILLLRAGEYEAARSLLIQVQKMPGLTPAQKQQMYVNYATCRYKMGDIAQAVNLLEKQHAHAPCGLIFQTLGFLYVEQGDAEKAKAFNLSALEYDDEDPIVLDNVGQTYYRLLGDEETARRYFKAALKRKPGQIDTLYFMADIDEKAGRFDKARERLELALEGRFSPLNYATREMVQAKLDALPAGGGSEPEEPEETDEPEA